MPGCDRVWFGEPQRGSTGRLLISLFRNEPSELTDQKAPTSTLQQKMLEAHNPEGIEA